MSEYIHKGRLYNAVFLASRLRRNDMLELIDNAPTVDAVEVLRCKDCIYYSEREFDGELLTECDIIDRLRPDQNGYCSYGERRGNNG